MVHYKVFGKGKEKLLNLKLYGLQEHYVRYLESFDCLSRDYNRSDG
jgi:hypothetical protein